MFLSFMNMLNVKPALKTLPWKKTTQSEYRYFFCNKTHKYVYCILCTTVHLFNTLFVFLSAIHCNYQEIHVIDTIVNISIFIILNRHYKNDLDLTLLQKQVGL